MEFNTPLKKLQFSLVRVDVDGGAVATAWAFGYETPRGIAPFLVANASAVAGARGGRIVFTESENGSPQLGRHIVLRIDDMEGLWHRHPRPEVDVALTPLAPLMRDVERAERRAYCPLITSGLIPTPEEREALEALEDVVVLHFVPTTPDMHHGLPLLRKGYTASPVQADYRAAPAFLVGGAGVAGATGAPVLAIGRPGQGEVTHTLLLGVISSVRGGRPDQPEELAVAWKASVIVEAAEAVIARMDQPAAPPTASP
jgi:hypothetical protein